MVNMQLKGLVDSSSGSHSVSFMMPREYFLMLDAESTKHMQQAGSGHFYHALGTGPGATRHDRTKGGNLIANWVI